MHEPKNSLDVIYRPQTKVVFFTRVCLFKGGVSRPTSRGEVQGSGRGLVSRPTPRAGVSRPTPTGEFEGSGWGFVSRPTPGGGGVSRPTPRGVGCVSKHALRQTPPWMVTAAGNTHPTGTHSWLKYVSKELMLHRYTGYQNIGQKSPK